MTTPSTSNQTCTRCVMDASDPSIVFGADGMCNYCARFLAETSKYWYRSDGNVKLEEVLAGIRKRGRGKKYDAILGLSGGIDSSYLALKARGLGLRLLAVHVDSGWNSEVAVANINKLIDVCGYDLFTHVVNWEEMRDLQLAYLKSGVSNQDVPQDHAYFASLYNFAVQNRVETILSGGNISTEGIAPEWMFDPLDVRNLNAIHARHGTIKLKEFQRISFFKRFVIFPFVHRLRVVRLLNYMDYSKETARRELTASVGWRDYGRKHGESHFTRFYQNYYLPTRYGYDKRRPHLSSLIVTGQITREQAIEKLKEPLYGPDELAKDFDYIATKLQISHEELQRLMNTPLRAHEEYPNQYKLYSAMKKVQAFTQRITGKRVRVYS